MRHNFSTEQLLIFPIAQVFAFLANPDNLPKVMPPWQRASVEEAFIVRPSPPRESRRHREQQTIAAGSGTRLILGFRPFPLSPIRLSWEAEITDFAWNRHFCDRQLRGPFSYWEHCHHLRPGMTPQNQPATLVIDEIEYELPFGPLNILANNLFIRRQLRNTFSYRHARTAAILSGCS